MKRHRIQDKKPQGPMYITQMNRPVQYLLKAMEYRYQLLIRDKNLVHNLSAKLIYLNE